MSRDEVTPQEEQLAALLAAYDDALAAGAPPPGDALQPRLQEDLQCLQLLHQLRPGGTDKETGRPGDKETNATPVSLSPGLPVSRSAQQGEPGERYTLASLPAQGGIGPGWLAHATHL